MAFFGGGGGQDVSITINGDSANLQGAVRGAEESLRSLSRAADSGNQSFTGYRFTMNSLGNDLLNNMGTFGATVITLNSLLGVFGAITGAVSDVVGGIAQFVEGLAQVAASDAWQVIQYGADQVERLGQAMFDLNNQTERNVTNWTYLYGGPNGGGTQNAQQLAAWSQQFSMQIPYTRQDLMNAITTLSAEPGANPAQIESQMALLANVASTQGRPGLTLAWAAQAALRAAQAGKGGGGSMRMLMMDLNLNKGELSPYGYNEHDPSTFWPALEGYEKAKGSYGAAKDISTKTFWGAESSFVDRIQNFLLAAGGTNVFGTVQKGSFFGNLKQDLTDISAWMDAHQAQLKTVSDIISHLYGAAVQTGTNGLTAFLETLHSTGIDTQLLNDLSAFAQWLGQPDTQAGAREVGDLIGQLAGVAGLDLRGIFGSFWQGLTSSGIGQTLLDDVRGAIQWLSDPQHQHDLEQLGVIVGSGIGTSLQSLSTTLGDLVTNGTQLMQSLRPDDLALIAGVFAEISLAIAATGDSVTFLARETVDLIHIMEDFSNGNWKALGADIGQANSDMGAYFNSLQNDMGNSLNQSTQINLALMQWQKTHPSPATAAHWGHLSESMGHLSENAGGAAALHPSAATSGHGRAAALMGADLTEGVHAGLIGNLSTITRAGRQVAQHFADAVANATDYNHLGQHIAKTISDAVQRQLSEQWRGGPNATSTPGSYRSFGVRGAGW